MLASRISRNQRRGIVLVLVLAMLGLLALIGVTFATFSGQSRINSRNNLCRLLEPQDDELMDFALSQLINDTGDPRSVIRGHSLARDMYGNDGYGQRLSAIQPHDRRTVLHHRHRLHRPRSGSTGNPLYQLTTNIASNDPNFYGYNFTAGSCGSPITARLCP